MVERDLRSKYVGSLIGVFWTVINPLLLLLVFTFIFSVIFRARFGNEASVGISALYILCGLIPWLGFQEGVARSANYLVENRNLVSRIKFPTAVLPGVPVLSGFCGQLIGFLVLLVWAGIKGKLQMPAIFFLPVWMVFQICFGLGLGYLFSVAGVWVRDLIQLVPVLLLVWMYATPIFYPAALVPEKFQVLVWLNPIAQLVNGYRRMILEGAMPSLNQTIYLAGAALVSLIIGGLIFSRLSKGIPDRI
jgi:ABC-type polysaccharide/polyol phosphate export permease